MSSRGNQLMASALAKKNLIHQKDLEDAIILANQPPEHELSYNLNDGGRENLAKSLE